MIQIYHPNWQPWPCNAMRSAGMKLAFISHCVDIVGYGALARGSSANPECAIDNDWPINYRDLQGRGSVQ